MREVFEDIENKLKSALDENNENLFGTVEINRGQMLQVKGMNNTGANIYFPAIFYKPEEIQSIPRPNNIYVVEMRIRFQLVIHNLIHNDKNHSPLDIFDLSDKMDRVLLNGKWELTNLASIQKGFNVFPDTFDNNLIYEANFWLKYWSTYSYTYKDYVDVNDPLQNENAPISLDVCGDIFEFNDENIETGEIPPLSSKEGFILVDNLGYYLGDNPVIV